MHLAVQATSPGVQASMHLTTSDCEVSAGDSLDVEVTVDMVVGVVDWAVAMASRPESTRVAKRILKIMEGGSSYWVSKISQNITRVWKRIYVATAIVGKNECRQAATQTEIAYRDLARGSLGESGA